MIWLSVLGMADVSASVLDGERLVLVAGFAVICRAGSAVGFAFLRGPEKGLTRRLVTKYKKPA